ncbi:34921_t:CDS:2 [Gigaspora margarita]|uniref:34921_t:CDS:1 n=1 Tax=Gigaspora margarita TaxID=4874 RepID=A0ABN7UX29_GIGMA|nr:34921_t:CDS:2 [Gigaspora margarita]
MSELNISNPPKIIATDGIAQIEVFSANEPNTNELPYCKGFVNGTETSKLTDLIVKGSLPSWLKVEFFTVGPATFDIKYTKMVGTEDGYESATATFSMGHWFDGLPLVNRFAIDGGSNKINYRSKLTCKKYEEKIRDNHGIVTKHPFSLFKTHPNQTPLAKIMGTKRTTKPGLEPCSANISVNYPFNKPGEKPKIYCQNHASQVVELDAYDLTPTRLFSWDELDPTIKGDHASPHSHFDETTGELINFTMEYHTAGTTYNFFSVSLNNPNGQLIGSVAAKMSYVHSFGVTPKFIILVLFPYYGKGSGFNFTWSDNILESFEFDQNEPTLFHVISRQKKQHVATYKSDPCFAFHQINAFEDDNDNLYLDIACYDNSDILNDFELENLRKGLSKRLHMTEVRRFILRNIQQESTKFATIPQPSRRGSLLTSLFWSRSTNQDSPWPIADYVRCADSTLELPRINPRFQRLRYRYVYGIGLSAKAAGQENQIWDSLIKCDLDVKEVVAMWGSDNCYPSEAVFVPHPGKDCEEDEGVLLSIVFDGGNNKSFFLVLDARTMSELVRAYLPQVVPLSFGHGAFKRIGD